MEEQLIRRINELAKKSKNEGLTEEEKSEQARLRAEYIQEFRKNLRSGLESITIDYPDGRSVSVKDLRKKDGSASTENR